MRTFTQWLEDFRDRGSDIAHIDDGMDMFVKSGIVTPYEAEEIRKVARQNPRITSKVIYNYIMNMVVNQRDQARREKVGFRKPEERVTYGGATPRGSGRVIRNYPKAAGAGPPI
jgi:hypothetical protein